MSIEETSLSGIWTGYYEYGEGYILPHFGERVSLFVEISEDENQFSGMVKESESEFLVPYDSEINGFRDDTFISFTKTYPVIPIIDPESNKIVYEQGELDVDHEGYYDRKNNAIYGYWTIKSEFEEDGESFDVYNGGIWYLEKSV